MSERGSFCTEYAYCGKCLGAFIEACRHIDVGSWQKLDPYPIVAGKAHGMYAGEEVDIFENARSEIEERLCAGHGLTLAVLPDSAPAKFLTFDNRKEAEVANHEQDDAQTELLWRGAVDKEAEVTKDNVAALRGFEAWFAEAAAYHNRPLHEHPAYYWARAAWERGYAKGRFAEVGVATLPFRCGCGAQYKFTAQGDRLGAYMVVAGFGSREQRAKIRAEIVEELSGPNVPKVGEPIRSTTTDARRWAGEFMDMYGGRITPDMETMVRWFADAIEVGRDAGWNARSDVTNAVCSPEAVDETWADDGNDDIHTREDRPFTWAKQMRAEGKVGFEKHPPEPANITATDWRVLVSRVNVLEAERATGNGELESFIRSVDDRTRRSAVGLLDTVSRMQDNAARTEQRVADLDRQLHRMGDNLATIVADTDKKLELLQTDTRDVKFIAGHAEQTANRALGTVQIQGQKWEQDCRSRTKLVDRRIDDLVPRTAKVPQLEARTAHLESVMQQLLDERSHRTLLATGRIGDVGKPE